MLPYLGRRPARAAADDSSEEAQIHVQALLRRLRHPDDHLDLASDSKHLIGAEQDPTTADISSSPLEPGTASNVRQSELDRTLDLKADWTLCHKNIR